ncbi:inactive protein RESTRICTED TEV MOVEMENT 2 [Daucus carota subsp. sativus]|uniref:inactive protein RESTRICTED TEV MOVEMENT 2 n=1 Tax=Daucus carota subsp. sativus TaxID=79200 RepID=UPI0030839703
MATPRGPRGFSSRPSAAVPRVYVKYTPSSEWKQEKESDILLIFLPDFLKQDIRVRTETGNILRVTGERALGGNKFSRFQQDFEIPNNCIIKAIRAKFEGGILTITFPRVPVTTATEKPKPSQPAPKLPPSQKQDKNEPTESAIPRTTALPAPVSKEPTPRTTEAAIPRKTALPAPGLKEPTPHATEGVLPRTPALPSPGIKELERSRFQTPSPPKPRNASNIDADSPKEPRKLIESSRPPLVVDDKTPFLPTLGTGKGTTREEVLNGKDGLKNEKMEKKKEDEMYEDGFTKRAGMEKVEDVQTQGATERYENVDEATNKIVMKSGEVDLKEAMKNVGRRMNEEKGLMVNMGAAVMVIVGLGAYVYHSLSSGKLAKR